MQTVLEAFLHGTSIGTRENATTPEELEKRPGFVSSMRRIEDAACLDKDIFSSAEIEKVIDLDDGDPPPEPMVKRDRNTVEGRRMLQAMMDAEAAS